MGQRLTGMSGNQAHAAAGRARSSSSPSTASAARPVSELLPHTAKIVDELCFVKSMHTEAINHDPAITFFQTGHQLAGRPSMGAWLSYGLGSANENLPGVRRADLARTASTSRSTPGCGATASCRASTRACSSAPASDPVLYLKNPDGVSAASRRKMLDRLAELHALQFDGPRRPGDQRPRRAVRDGLPHADERAGGDGRRKRAAETSSTCTAPRRATPGTFAANCLLARRLAERDVRFIQLYHPGWDHHGGLPDGIRRQCQGRRPGLLRA